ncbi:hypothetical protein POK33_37940 [Burkholderia cenocepacia]|uniref:hypothetical protein n=1 Tax=Burkholderia cenocepacia TaxID=95486 RepID=UPI0023B91DA2|nr:hypothetical protein [Burkholderia cenocepacia]MDF0504831.1 hypothetical protein [Burkholderia cenocepacia]MDF0506538.1 hypothetical protein [Burkholderia cenocepacia]
MDFSISPQVAAQVAAGIRVVSSHELTEGDRKLISRLEANKDKSLKRLEKHAAMYIAMFA